MDYYYLDVSGQVQGPLPLDALVAMRKRGIITDSTMVSHVGAPQWVLYQELAKELAAASLPPVPQYAKSQGGIGAGIIVVGSLFSVVVLAVAAFIGWQYFSPRAVDKKHQQNSAVTKAAASANESPSQGTTNVAAQSTTAPQQATAHPLAEWYDFGYRQGNSARRVHGWLGNRPQATRQELIQLLANLEIEISSLNSEGLDMTYQGYKDAMEGNSMRYAYTPTGRVASVLPKQMRGYYPHSSTGSSGADGERHEIDHALAATVMVFEGKGSGSGFFFAPGYILTNQHVVEDTKMVEVRIEESIVLKGRVVAVAAHLDAAVIKVDYDGHAILPLADANAVKVGDEIFGVGYPVIKDISATVTFGRISNTYRLAKEGPSFQIDMTINSGNSGGPCLNKAGQVIGINTSGLANAERYNFALRIDAVVDFVRKAVPEAKFNVAGE